MAPNKEKSKVFAGHDPDSLAKCEELVSDLTKSSPSMDTLHKESFGRPHKDHNVLLQSLGAPHVGSFNFMLDKV
jgi:hypothetical protein